MSKLNFPLTVACVLSTLYFSNALAESKLKNFTITVNAQANPVGGNGKGTYDRQTKNFRVSSEDAILKESLVVTVLGQGRGNSSCNLHIIKESQKQVEVNGIPVAMTFPTEVQLEAYATSPGCTLTDSIFGGSDSCIGKSSKQVCQLTGEYTDN